MRRAAIVAAVIASVVLCALLGARYLLTLAGRAAERRLVYLAGEHGFEISAVTCRTTSFRWPGSIRWEGFSLQGRDAGREMPLPLGGFTISVESATATLDRFGTRAIAVSLDGLLLTALRDAQPASDSPLHRFDSVSGRNLTVRAPVDFLNPRAAAAQLKAILEESRILVRTGRCKLPVTFEGTVTFPFKGTATAGIFIRRESFESVLTMDHDDLLTLSKRLGLQRPMTPEEAAFLADHPLQVPRLLEFRDQARSQAEEERRRDGTFPADAYRHLLWSYLLTAAYGEHFATEVTDAHERGLTGNTDAERRMDLSNNALGRWYAGSGVPAAALPERARSDSRVIRRPREALGRRAFGE